MALDETDRCSMIVVAVSFAALVIAVGWRVRPRPAVRAARVTARSPRWVMLASVALVVVLAPPLGVAIVVASLFHHRWTAARRASRAARRIATDYPDALDLLVLSIRAGFVPAQAVVEITPFLPLSIRPAFAAVGAAMDRGERFADALGQLDAELGPIAQPLVDSLSAAERYGLPLAPVLQRLTLEARQQRRRDADANARELPVRLAVPLVLCTLPSFVLLAIVPLLLGALSSLHT
jgi:tight adherence protein C